MRISAPDTALEALASWASDLAFGDIPDAVIDTSKLLILDTLGVAIAATADRVGDSILDWADTSGAAGGASVVGTSKRLSGADAALVNGTLAHALDFDDHGFGGHATACVLPAVLAAVEESGADGRSLLTAYVAGMEAFGRLAVNMPVPNIHEYGFHPTAVLGIVATAVGAAKAYGLTRDELAEAIAVSTVGGAGLTASFGTMAKPLHAGYSAQGGVRTAQLARSGFFGNRSVFEEHEGYGEAYVRGDVDWEGFKASLDGPFRLEVKQPSIKQYPCCGGNQRSIQNLSRIMGENDLEMADVDKVELHINPRQLTSLRYEWASNAYEAKFCLLFNVAVTLAKGAPTLAAYRDAYWDDPEVLEARERIQLIQDVPGDDKHNLVLTVITRDGRQFSKPKPIVHGSAEDPMERDEVAAKYVDSCSYSDRVPQDATKALHESVFRLETAGSEFLDAFASLHTDRV